MYIQITAVVTRATCTKKMYITALFAASSSLLSLCSEDFVFNCICVKIQGIQLNDYIIIHPYVRETVDITLVLWPVYTATP